MGRYETRDIRNLCLVGHGSSGKTTLADALLFKAKAVARAGSVDDGTSVFDFEPEERERRHSLDLAAAHVSFQGRELNLLDAPGYPDFVGEAICGLHAVETAVLCIDAAAGIRINTVKMWEQARALGRGVLIVLTKMDQDNAAFAGRVAAIRERFGRECVPVLMPLGEGAAFRGVVSLVGGADGVPEGLQALASEAREKLMEADDRLLEEFLAGQAVTAEEIGRALPGEIARGGVVPILCVSAKKDLGVAELLDFIARYAPPPEGSPSGPLRAQVFKSVADPVVHRLSFVRVSSGTLAAEHPLHNARTGKASRIGALFKAFGKDHHAVASVPAGDLVCVSKVDDLNTGDTIGDAAGAEELPRFVFPVSMVAQAVEPRTKQDLARMSESLHKMADSDPTFHFTRDPGTGELVVTGRSKLHLDLILARLRRKFHVEVVTHPPKLALREAITAPAEGHHKHRKQSGGHGQYGEVFLRIRPAARGAGFTFTDAITQGKIPQQYVPAIEKGIRKTLEKGVLAGYPLTDLEVEVYDGSYHDVDSGPASFELAGSKAFKDAFAKAKPVLLEPVVHIEVTVPARFMGNITGDLNSRRGRILGMDSHGALQVVRAQIPMMEIMDYETQLRSVTGGEGSYTIEPSHYDTLPHRIAEGVIAKAKRPLDEEE
jgi:elongation factor G